jgi:nucleoside recognition membrane protein YjiH
VQKPKPQKEGQKMFKMFKKFNYKKAIPVLSAAGAVAAGATNALATPILDFTAIGTAITGELSPAITAAMPIAGLALAATIGWKIYKRFAKG